MVACSRQTEPSRLDGTSVIRNEQGGATPCEPESERVTTLRVYRPVHVRTRHHGDKPHIREVDPVGIERGEAVTQDGDPLVLAIPERLESVRHIDLLAKCLGARRRVYDRRLDHPCRRIGQWQDDGYDHRHAQHCVAPEPVNPRRDHGDYPDSYDGHITPEIACAHVNEHVESDCGQRRKEVAKARGDRSPRERRGPEEVEKRKDCSCSKKSTKPVLPASLGERP